MTIDFESKDGRQNYLNEKLDNLLSGINASYGQVLLDELVTRLQRTLADFNEEVGGIMGDLKESSDRRNQIIHDLMEGNETASGSAPSDGGDTPGGGTEMSEWEKRLEGMKNQIRRLNEHHGKIHSCYTRGLNNRCILFPIFNR